MKLATRISFCFASTLPLVSSTCYFPNGNTTNDAACNSDVESSTCCGPGYACLSNNLCALTEQVDSEIVKTSSLYVRGGCTDETWSSDNCPKFCLNATNTDNLGIGGMGVGRCGGVGQANRYYCRNTETARLSDKDLCDNKNYYFEFDEFPTTVTIIGASTTPRPSQSTSKLPTSSPTRTIVWPNNSEAPPELKLGLGLGLGLGLPLVAAIGLIGYLVNRARFTRVELELARKKLRPDQWEHRISDIPRELNDAVEVHEVSGNRVVQAHELSPLRSPPTVKSG